MKKNNIIEQSRKISYLISKSKVRHKIALILTFKILKKIAELNFTIFIFNKQQKLFV